MTLVEKLPLAVCKALTSDCKLSTFPSSVVILVARDEEIGGKVSCLNVIFAVMEFFWNADIVVG